MLLSTLLHLPDDRRPRTYNITFGLYTQPDHAALPVFDDNGKPIEGNQVRQESHRVSLPKMQTAPANVISTQARFASALALDGYTSNIPLDSAKPGDTVHIREYW